MSDLLQLPFYLLGWISCPFFADEQAGDQRRSSCLQCHHPLLVCISREERRVAASSEGEQRCWRWVCSPLQLPAGRVWLSASLPSAKGAAFEEVRESLLKGVHLCESNVSAAIIQERSQMAEQSHSGLKRALAGGC